ncbi:MAG: hypothetical protein K0R93_3668, partial [Anaerosolibacter sp.]|uniref:hypothetical protein n=1 Tax=Anaerosolibacter sp. TaxID=1872527 RepID=UPI002608E6F5
DEANKIRDKYKPGGSGGGDDTGSDWDDDDDDDGGSSGGGYNPPPRPAYETRGIEYNGTAPGINSKISNTQVKQPPLNMDLKTKQLLAQDARIKGKSKDIITLEGKLGTGLQIKPKLLGVELELGASRYYEFAPNQELRESLEFDANIKITNQIMIGFSSKGSVDTATGKQVEGSPTAFLGIKVGDRKIGFGDIPNSSDVEADLIGLGVLTPLGGAEGNVKVNLSELGRRIKENLFK